MSSPAGSPIQTGSALTDDIASPIDFARIDVDLFTEKDQAEINDTVQTRCIEMLGGPTSNGTPTPMLVLSVVLEVLRKKYTGDLQLVRAYSDEIIGANPGLEKELEAAWQSGEFESTMRLAALWSTNTQFEPKRFLSNMTVEVEALRIAYNYPYIGNAARTFLAYLNDMHTFFQRPGSVRIGAPYGKVVSIVQSSGTGKSRMLKELGTLAFTLPICLREPEGLGYPNSDAAVYHYFIALTNKHSSAKTHAGISCFLGAAYRETVKWLTEKKKHFSNATRLLVEWNHMMNDDESRAEFFQTVVDSAQDGFAKCTIPNTPLKLKEQKLKNPEEQKTKNVKKQKLAADKLVEIARSCYSVPEGIQNAAQDLDNFMKNLGIQNGLFVTYFDEAHTLKDRFWALLRLLSFQNFKMHLWVVFMDTKSSVAYFTPSSGDSSSMRLRDQRRILLPPYFDLGFDQNVIGGQKPDRKVDNIIASHLQTLQCLAKYGRPLWHSLMSATDNDEVNVMLTAMAKLLCGEDFQPTNANHVLAVFSQLFCVDLAFSNAEAIKIADRSVAQHMRLLTGLKKSHDTFYTESPSEPILAVAAFNLLYDSKCCWSESLPTALNTFSTEMCKNGIVEKGLFGELAARLLLLTARHVASPVFDDAHDILAPIHIITFLDTLFPQGWAGQRREEYEKNFANGYVNFTHWIQTDDPLPKTPDL
ncbi:hypothetical protein BD410DRAFT_778936 [Rickenella mellea]|uniref:Uncharacterized protein n=1 Tax=Rickenella mellea TaxID=50990 RepID=A0A4Y7PH33_9AGAM|nr:hypothetical protein BD410DRAFT_778936 [Rickenella mellea]